MRNWNLYLESSECDADILAEWEEVLLKDFLCHSKDWLDNNRDDTYWREDLR